MRPPPSAAARRWLLSGVPAVARPHRSGERPATGRRQAAPSAPREPSTSAASRRERREAARARRSRVLLAGSVVLAVVVVVAWFPASALYHQHQQLASASSQLHQERRQDRALSEERRRLGSSAEVGHIAQEQYQLVPPGQQAYEVLPPSGQAGGSYDGDPGLQAPVTPSGTAELPSADRAQSTTRATTRSRTAGAGDDRRPTKTVAATGLGSRILHTLEFWR